MKVLIVNTYDTGGAGKASARLHMGLLDANIDSKLLLAVKNNDFPESFLLRPKGRKTFIQKIENKLFKILKEFKIVKTRRKNKKERFVAKRSTGLELYTYPDSNFDITASDLYKEADLINLHWVSNFLDYKQFFTKNTKPVVWTLHDMNPFSGGEHYKETFLGINDQGKPINRQLSTLEKEQFKSILKIKTEALEPVENLHFVTLCHWMTNEIKQSGFFSKFPVTCIPNGINTTIFKPRHKEYSRDLLQLSCSKKVVLFVADSISNHRKGYAFLKRAFNLIEDENIILLAIGAKTNLLMNNNKVVELGHIKNEQLLSVAYSAADVFVIPSLMDNLPNTVLEALLCGTPVIGFPVGGIRDMIQNGKNGLITNTISVAALSQAINAFFKTGVQLTSEEIRQDALTKYDQKIQANNYIELFKKILKKP
ncbi:glycosyltransferase [Lacinutrix neustonica]|uniref:Glycosyltransferase n=1 Tax=Lacinutrix neustonica TaxID=2980107 RepID=A0A9E8MUS3_9FLAO|nr:glycosyltransferase [Lacinutrix neustonica]WAC01933.1 glycosyltransferase [Lacinutrix neustonica]